jgi:hypothetical protein
MFDYKRFAWSEDIAFSQITWKAYDFNTNSMSSSTAFENHLNVLRFLDM